MSTKRKQAVEPDVSASIVCDLGSGYIKAGLVRDLNNFPRLIRPSTSSEDIEQIFESVFNVVGKPHSTSPLSPSNKVNRAPPLSSADGRGIVLTESMSSAPSLKEKEKLTQLMFERFEFNFLNISPSAALVLAARGTTTGLVVDCGHSKTEIVPVANGFVQKGNVRRLQIGGGSTVTRRFIDLLKRSESCNYCLDSDRDFFAINSAKDSLCFVALDLPEERHIADKTHLTSRTFRLPDKTEIFANHERFLAPEILFQPKFCGDICSDSLGISELIIDSINSSPIDLRSSLFRSIILAGGTTLINNFPQRVAQDLLLSGPNKVYVDACPDRMFSAFRGGCVMGSLNNPDWWISKSQYEEKGFPAVFKQ